MENLNTSNRISFLEFLNSVYLSEHKHNLNRLFHLLGVLLGIVTLLSPMFGASFWIVFLFPFSHAVPGLIGHRLFERNAEVGDSRITRRDFPLWWFIVANHLLLFLIFNRKKKTPSL